MAVVATASKKGRSASSTIEADELSKILIQHITGPKTLSYPETKAAGVKPESIVKMAPLFKKLLAREDTLSIKKTTLTNAFKMVRHHYGKTWRLDDEFEDAWVQSMTTRMFLMCQHLREARRKGTVWVNMHFEEFAYKKAVKKAAAGAKASGDADVAIAEEEEEEDEEEKEAEVDDDDDDDEEEPTRLDRPKERQPSPTPAHPLPAWVTGWDPTGETPFRSTPDGKRYEAGIRVYEPPGAEDGDMMNVAFREGDVEIEMELSNMTVELWREKVKAGTCGKFAPQAGVAKKYPVYKTQDGAELHIKHRTNNKELFLVVLENQKQILQCKIDERGEEKIAEIVLAVVQMYANGDIKKVELRAKKMELTKISDKPPIKAAAAAGVGKGNAGKCGWESDADGAAASSTGAAEVVAKDTGGKGDGNGSEPVATDTCGMGSGNESAPVAMDTCGMGSGKGSATVNVNERTGETTCVPPMHKEPAKRCLTWADAKDAGEGNTIEKGMGSSGDPFPPQKRQRKSVDFWDMDDAWMDSSDEDPFAW